MKPQGATQLCSSVHDRNVEYVGGIPPPRRQHCQQGAIRSRRGFTAGLSRPGEPIHGGLWPEVYRRGGRLPRQAAYRHTPGTDTRSVFGVH